jgi:hypothetical protein
VFASQGVSNPSASIFRRRYPNGHQVHCSLRCMVLTLATGPSPVHAKGRSP